MSSTGKTYRLPLTRGQAEVLYDAVQTELFDNEKYLSKLEASLRSCAAHGQPERARQYKGLLRNAQAGRSTLKTLAFCLKLIAEATDD